jgi:hypothetical protein
VTTDKVGKTVAVVSTEGQYQYLGQLLVDFNAKGEVVGTSGDTLPSTAAQVAELWGPDSNAPYAAGTRGGAVKALTDAVGAVISAKDALILGKTAVFLEGRRTVVRQQESNFGNLTADANLWYARQYDSNVRVSLKNGGGIRNAIGSIDANGGLQPTKPNAAASKAAGDVSRLEIEDSLKFNNALSLLTVKASQLKMLLEHGVAASNGAGTANNTPGQFSQLGGIVVVADLGRTAQTITSASNVILAVNAGQRIRYAALTDDTGRPTDVIIADGEVLDPDRPIRMVTLDFLAKAGSANSDFGGDSYPFPYILRLNGAENYDRKDLNSGSLAPALPGSFPSLSSFATAGTEQDAFAEYLMAFHATTPFGLADTAVDLDRRIVQGAADSDNDGYSNAEEVSLYTVGMDADVAATAGQVNALGRIRAVGRAEVTANPLVYSLYTADQFNAERLAGRTDVTSNPLAYSLFTGPQADVRLDGLVLPVSAPGTLSMKLQSSDNLSTWTDEVVVQNVQIDLSGPKKFFRFQAVVP